MERSTLREVASMCLDSLSATTLSFPLCAWCLWWIQRHGIVVSAALLSQVQLSSAYWSWGAYDLCKSWSLCPLESTWSALPLTTSPRVPYQRCYTSFQQVSVSCWKMQEVPTDHSPIVAVLLLQLNPKRLLPVICGLPYVGGIAWPLGSKLV